MYTFTFSGSIETERRYGITPVLDQRKNIAVDKIMAFGTMILCLVRWGQVSYGLHFLLYRRLNFLSKNVSLLFTCVAPWRQLSFFSIWKFFASTWSFLWIDFSVKLTFGNLKLERNRANICLHKLLNTEFIVDRFEHFYSHSLALRMTRTWRYKWS